MEYVKLSSFSDDLILYQVWKNSKASTKIIVTNKQVCHIFIEYSIDIQNKLTLLKFQIIMLQMTLLSKTKKYSK